MTADTTAVLPSERISVRFGASLISNIARLGLSMASGLLVARGLGVARYGDYQFLLASVAGLAQFIDLGTSQAFYTFVSRQRRGMRFIAIYGAWLAMQFAVIVGAIAVLAPTKFVATVWLGQDRWTILLAFVATFFMNELWEAVSQLGEARRRTVLVQSALVVQALAHLALIAAATYTSLLSVTLVFGLIACEYGALIAVLGPPFVRENIEPLDVEDSVRQVAGEFYRYCKPLFFYALCSFVLLFADRWLLQRFGGAGQQGFFAVAQQFSTVSLLATNAVLQVFWKEIAAAAAAGDHARAAILYRSTSQGLYFVAAWVSCLLLPYSQHILTATVGREYAGASLPFALMLMYPLHQSLGRITGSFFHAVGDTRIYSRIGIGMMLVSLPTAYFLLAPRTALVSGLGLGAAGLSIKMLAINVLSVNISAYAIARRLGTAFDWYHQIVILGLLLALAFGCRWVAQALFGGANLVAAIGAGIVMYVAVSAVGLFRYPEAMGLSRSQAGAIARGYRDLVLGGRT